MGGFCSPIPVQMKKKFHSEADLWRLYWIAALRGVLCEDQGELPINCPENVHLAKPVISREDKNISCILRILEKFLFFMYGFFHSKLTTNGYYIVS